MCRIQAANWVTFPQFRLLLMDSSLSLSNASACRYSVL
jgi:hypothetical protein